PADRDHAAPRRHGRGPARGRRAHPGAGRLRTAGSRDRVDRPGARGDDVRAGGGPESGAGGADRSSRPGGGARHLAGGPLRPPGAARHRCGQRAAPPRLRAGGRRARRMGGAGLERTVDGVLRAPRRPPGPRVDPLPLEGRVVAPEPTGIPAGPGAGGPGRGSGASPPGMCHRGPVATVPGGVTEFGGPAVGGAKERFCDAVVTAADGSTIDATATLGGFTRVDDGADVHVRYREGRAVPDTLPERAAEAGLMLFLVGAAAVSLL